MQIFSLICQKVNLFSKIALQNVDWVSPIFVVDTKIIYTYNFVAPLKTDITLKIIIMKTETGNFKMRKKEKVEKMKSRRMERHDQSIAFVYFTSPAYE